MNDNNLHINRAFLQLHTKYTHTARYSFIRLGSINSDEGVGPKLKTFQ